MHTNGNYISEELPLVVVTSVDAKSNKSKEIIKITSIPCKLDPPGVES